MDYTVTRANLAAFAQLVAETLVRRVFAGKARRKITHEQFVIVTANAVVECFDDVERARDRPGRAVAVAAAGACLECGHAAHAGRCARLECQCGRFQHGYFTGQPADPR